MKKLTPLFAILFSTLALTGAPMTAEDTKPLEAGAMVPGASVQTAAGESVDLAQHIEGKPSVLIFYRGSWCPYCNRHLAGLMDIEDDLKGLGYQIIGLSPDKPEGLKEATEKNSLTYTLLSDSGAEAMKAFGLAFKVDEKTRDLYKGYGIDLKKASGEDHYLLPVPAVYVVDGHGKILFAHVNPDYRNRLSNEDLLKAAEGA